MASFKSHPFFYTSLLLAGALTAGQAWLLYSQRSAAQRVSAEIAEKKQTLDGFSFQKPFPSRENLTAVEKDLRQTEKTRDEIRSALRATSEEADKIAAAVVPETSTDAWYVIANYVAKLRAQAQEANIRIASSDRPSQNPFGFSDYVGEGPARDLIAPVFLQTQYAEYLISALLTAKYPPKEFVSLQRERPVSAEQKRQIEEALAAGQSTPTFGDSAGGGDYFTIDPRISARVAERVETSPFRLTFIGHTAALRAFLNELALFKLPVVVRSVEVESLNAGGGGGNKTYTPKANNNPFGDGDTAAAQAEAVKPIIEQTDSRFIVTVEIVSLVNKTDSAAVPAPANTP